jgi:hypothetical protein
LFSKVLFLYAAYITPAFFAFERIVMPFKLCFECLPSIMVEQYERIKTTGSNEREIAYAVNA